MKWLFIGGLGLVAFMLYQKAHAAAVTAANSLPNGSVAVSSGKVLGIPYTIYMANNGYYLNISGITTRGPFTQQQAYDALVLFGGQTPQATT